MADTIADIKIAANIWHDIYGLTGISVGTALDIWNKGSNPALLVIKSTLPTSNTDGIPIYAGQFDGYRNISSGESGAWVYSELGTTLSVQKGTI